MEIYPAIDLRGGRVVRLKMGDPEQETEFARDPVRVAEAFAAQGARWLHVVNLDGAFGGGVGTFVDLLTALCAVGPRVQCGGGLRSPAQIEAALAAGAARVVLGTAAVDQPELVRRAVERFGTEAVAAGVDARAGRVRVRGWQAEGDMGVMELGTRMRELGVTWLVHTDIGRDGLLRGVNATAAAELARATGLNVIASGGVASLDDVAQVLAAETQGTAGLIVGRALYEGTLDLAAAVALASRAPGG